jgi:hypothetical protein
MKIIVLAFKYNDIFYAQATPEFEKSSEKILIKFVTENFIDNPFPGEDLFTKIINIKVKSHNKYHLIGIINDINKLFRKNKFIGEYILLLSNIELIITRFIAKKNIIKSIVLLEDGLMNYYYPIRPSTGLKRIIEFLLRINFNTIKKNISGTYLNNPDLALYYFGKKLRFSHTNFQCNDFLVKKIVNKKLFIGGGYFENFNIITKVKIIKYLIEFENIDYFIPHHFDTFDWSSLIEIIDLRKEKITLEMIFDKISFIKIYGFGTSVQLNAIFRELPSEIVFIECTANNVQNVAFDYIKEKSKKTINIDNLIANAN